MPITAWSRLATRRRGHRASGRPHGATAAWKTSRYCDTLCAPAAARCRLEETGRVAGLGHAPAVLGEDHAESR